jgi:hypothetical protein
MWWKKEKDQDPFEVVVNHILRLESSLESDIDLLINDMNNLFKRITEIEGKINKLMNRRQCQRGSTYARSPKNMQKV